MLSGSITGSCTIQTRGRPILGPTPCLLPSPHGSQGKAGPWPACLGLAFARRWGLRSRRRQPPAAREAQKGGPPPLMRRKPHRRPALRAALQRRRAAAPERGPSYPYGGPSAAPAPARRGAQGRGAATRASRGRPATGAASGERGRGPAPAEARYRAAAGPSTNRATGDRAQPGQARPEGPPRRGLGLRRRARAQRQAGRGLSAKRPPQAARPATAPRPARGRARRRGAQPRQGGERGRGRRPRGRYAAGIQDSSCKPPAAWGKLGPLRGASWPVQAGVDPRRGTLSGCCR